MVDIYIGANNSITGVNKSIKMLNATDSLIESEIETDIYVKSTVSYQ